MGNHSIAILHHDGWGNLEESYSEIAHELDMITNVGVYGDRAVDIRANGASIATVIETHHSTEACLVLLSGSSVICMGKTDGRDGNSRPLPPKDLLNDILGPYGLKVIQKKK